MPRIGDGVFWNTPENTSEHTVFCAVVCGVQPAPKPKNEEEAKTADTRPLCHLAILWPGKPTLVWRWAKEGSKPGEFSTSLPHDAPKEVSDNVPPVPLPSA